MITITFNDSFIATDLKLKDERRREATSMSEQVTI